jgi:putative ABC transport system ATP-binding protein
MILADELTGSLDQKNDLKIMEILKELNRQGKTIIMELMTKSLADMQQK